MRLYASEEGEQRWQSFQFTRVDLQLCRLIPIDYSPPDARGGTGEKDGPHSCLYRSASDDIDHHESNLFSEGGSRHDMSERSNSDGQDQARAQRIRALLGLVPPEQLFPQYVDLRHRSLQTVIVTDAEPPTFSDDAFDTRRAYERIKGYLIWTDALNEQRKDTGKRIDDLLESSKNDQAAAMAGVLEIGLHLITITADAVAKHFGVLSEKMGVEVEASILDDIRMFETLRNDFEHPYDERGFLVGTARGFLILFGPKMGLRRSTGSTQ